MMHTKFLSKFQIISKLLAVRNSTYLLELRGTKFSFVPISGVPCVKRVEGFCYFNCNIFYYGRIKIPWYSK